MPAATAPRATALEARPSPLLTAWEGPRSLLELGALLGAGGLLALAPGGDGSPVVVLPGFTAGDGSTTSLRHVLRGLGHDVVGWGLGRNLGPSPAVLAGLPRLLSAVADRHGAPVSLVGMSLGGVFARMLASSRPDEVRRVVTLGIPYRLTDRTRTHAYSAYRRVGHRHAEMPPSGSTPLRVPTTSVWSRIDGVVPPNACREPDTPLAQSVGVVGSHSGLAHHPLVVHLVADRLALPVGDTSHFRPPPWLRPLYELDWS